MHSAKDSLKRLISKLEEESINEVQKRLFLDFICDLRPFVTRFDHKQNYDWFLMNTNTHVSNFYNDLSQNIFWNGVPGNHSEEKLALVTSTPFIIRQSIEYKIKRILGIDYILINGKPDSRSMEKCFRAIEDNIRFFSLKKFSFQTIKQIYSWTHYYIHGGYRAEPWRTETAINYLQSLFYRGPTSDNKLLSYYSGVEVKEEDLEIIIKNTEESIRRKVEGKVTINWLTRPEVAILKKN